MAEGMTLDEALDYIGVMEADEINHSRKGAGMEPNAPPGWWAVVVSMGLEDGVVAYFANERDAFRYRLWLIALACNPIN